MSRQLIFRSRCAFASMLSVLITILMVGPVSVANAQFSSGDYEKTAPYSALKIEGDKTMVRVEGDWFQLVSIQDVGVEDIVKKCQDEGWEYQRRMGEDVVKILLAMDKEIGETVSLQLKNSDGDLITKENARMTKQNRQAIWQANVDNDPERKNAMERMMRELQSRRSDRRSRRGTKLTADRVKADLMYFRKRLSSDFSYLTINEAPWESALQNLEDSIPANPSQEWLAMELQKVMGLFIDGHAGAKGGLRNFESGYLPFLASVSGDDIVAIKSDRTGLVDSGFPFLKSIDGIAMERWIEMTDPWVADGSPQLRVDRGLRLLRWIQHFRREMGLDISDSLDLQLVSRDGKSKTVTVPIAKQRPVYGPWPRISPNKVMDGNIGYLRLIAMDEGAVDSINDWMPRFKDTDGLIVDVRTNGGGSREALLELASYLMTSKDTPRIGNVAAYKLSDSFEEDHLSSARFVYREGSPRFDERAKDAIAEFKKNFRPEWELPEGKFSEWHYLVLGKSADDPRYDYRKPVVILMDERCFSATDIFLGAFKGWPNVTLVGVASSGGSAFSRGFSLPNSDIRIKCASMASFQPNGRLYDTNGIQPDVLITRPPEFFTNDGEDVDLQKALSLLRNGDE